MLPISEPEYQGPDRRQAARVTPLFRAAKLTVGAGEYLCIVRGVSATGLQMRVFSDLPRVGQMTLELGDGTCFPVGKVWERDRHAGFRFLAGIDLAGFLAGARLDALRKRPIRLKVRQPALLFSGNHNPYRATICDLSQHGACIECDSRLLVGQSFVLEGLLPTRVTVTVRWRREPHYGLLFDNIFSYEQLAGLTARKPIPFVPTTGWYRNGDD